MNLETNTCLYCNAIHASEARANYFYTCLSCNQTYIKYDALPTSPEDMLRESETMSPIILGARGKINNEFFEITGSITLFQTTKVVNIHTLLWYNGLYKYLIECDGDFSLIEYINELPDSNVRLVKVGKDIVLKEFGNSYCYSLDRTTLITLNGEGKLPFPKLTGSIFGSFLASDKKVAFCFFSKEKTHLLTGKFHELKEFNLSQIRTLHDWCK